MPDFTQILSKRAVDVEKPPLKPFGTYLAVFVGAFKHKTVVVQGEEKDVVAWTIKLISAKDDVDQEALANEKLGDIGSWAPFTYEMWIDGPEGEFKFRTFLEKTACVDPGPPEDSKSLGQMAGEVSGKHCVVTLVPNAWTDKNTGEPMLNAKIGAIAAA